MFFFYINFVIIWFSKLKSLINFRLNMFFSLFLFVIYVPKYAIINFFIIKLKRWLLSIIFNLYFFNVYSCLRNGFLYDFISLAYIFPVLFLSIFFEFLLFLIKKIGDFFFLFNLEFFFFFNFFILLFLLIYQLFIKLNVYNSKLFLLIYLFIFFLGFFISIYTFNYLCVFNDNYISYLLLIFEITDVDLSLYFNPDLDLIFDPELDSNLDSGLSPNLDSDLDSILYLNFDSDLDLDLYFDLSLGLWLDLWLNVNLDPNLDLDLDLNLDLDLESDLDIDFDLESYFDSDSDLDSYLESEFESYLELDLESEFELDLELEFESYLESEFELDLELEFESCLESEFELDLELYLESEFESYLDLELDLDPSFDTYLNFGSDLDSDFEIPNQYDLDLCDVGLIVDGVEYLSVTEFFYKLLEKDPVFYEKFNNKYYNFFDYVSINLEYPQSNIYNIYLFNSLFIYDPFIYFFKIIFIILSFFLYYIYYVLSIFYKNNNLTEDLLLIFLCICNIFLYISVNDLLIYYLILEVLTLTSYYLAASGKNSISLEAGYKYFILAGFFSSIFLIGICMVYYSIGFISNFDEISYFLSLFNGKKFNSNISFDYYLIVSYEYILLFLICFNFLSFEYFFNEVSFLIYYLNSLFSKLEIECQFINDSGSFIDDDFFLELDYIDFNFQLFVLVLGICFILIGLFFKLGVAPFHSWVPDVYDGSPLFVTIFFMTIIKLAHFLFLLRFIFVICLPILNFLQFIFLFFGLVSMFVGSVLALAQFKLKRIFAYSSINHIGLILILLAFSNVNGIETSLIYLLMYLIMLFLLFFIISLIILNYSNYSVNRVENYLVLNNLNSSFTGFSFSILLFSITLFSFIGVPPFIGFVIKYLVFYQILTAGLILSSLTLQFKYLTLFLIIFLSILSTFYYLRLIVKTFVDNNFYFVILNVKYLNNSNNLLLYIFSFIFLILVIFLGNYLDFFFGLFRWLLYFSHILSI